MSKIPDPGEIDPYRVDLLPLIGIDLGPLDDFNEDFDVSIERAQIEATKAGILFPILAVTCWDDNIFMEGSDAPPARMCIDSCDLDARTWIESLAWYGDFGDGDTESHVFLVNEGLYSIPNTHRAPPDPDSEGGGSMRPKPRSPQGSPGTSKTNQ